jgi:RHS repeat-associated protein
VTVAAYDDNDRLTSKSITLGSNVVGATSLSFGYDGINRRTSADMAEGGSYSSQIEWTYNTLSKPETEKQVIDGYNSGNGRTITYTWNVEGQKTGVEYPVSGEDLAYTLDALDRIDTIVRGSTTVVDYAFNGRRVIEKEYPGSRALYTYDTFGRLTQIHHKDNSSGNTLAKFEYGYDDAHMVTHQDKHYYDDVQNTRLTSETGDLGDQYGYDGAKRLDLVLRGVPSDKITTAIATNITNNDYVDKVEYAYDPTGNREERKIDGSTDTAYEYNAVNEMTKEAGVTQLYWDNGTFNQASTGSTRQYKHNHADQLADFKVDSNLSYVWHFDALGRRIEREAVGTGTSDSRWYYDGIHDVETVTWAGGTETLKLWYVFGETTDEVLEYVYAADDPDSVYYFHTDKLGSIMLAVDGSGTIQESYRYTEFGQTTVVDSDFNHTTRALSEIHNSKRYTARDRIIGDAFGDNWYHYRARTYRPDAGRFVQRDPLGLHDGSNSYTYALLKPLQHIDPLGLSALEECGSGCLATGQSCSICKTFTVSPGGGSVLSCHAEEDDWTSPDDDLSEPTEPNCELTSAGLLLCTCCTTISNSGGSLSGPNGVPQNGGVEGDCIEVDVTLKIRGPGGQGLSLGPVGWTSASGGTVEHDKGTVDVCPCPSTTR